MFFNKSASSQQSGFTLLEMTVALGIFVILFTLTLGIYSYSIRAEQRTIKISKLQKEAQLIMEILVKQIRSSKVDYQYYIDNAIINIDAGTNILALQDKNGNQTIFRFNAADETLEVCVVNCSAGGIFTAIPPQDVLIQDLTFFINPATNPFSLSAPPTEYPRVTTAMNLRNATGHATEDLLVQQTIPQRLAGP